MSNFIGRPPFSNSLWVGIETMQFHIAQTNFFLRTPGGPNEQFGTHEKLSSGGGGGGGVQGNLNWIIGCRGNTTNMNNHVHFKTF